MQEVKNKSGERIPIDGELERFALHLSPADNKRIMFSAGFGAGKSYFLDSFFTAHSDSYHSVQLYPVDYSVSSNEDIFELIKFDLLDALLKRYAEKIKLSEEDISQGLITQEFLRSEVNFYKVFKVFAKHFIPFGEAATDTLDALKKLFDAHNTFSGEIRRTGTDSAEEFIKTFQRKSGSVRELDGTTLLIRDFVSRVRGDEDKPVVLVIDDLDRLDPEHIFRIFNVFTAHHDSRSEENKFGFDKVVFVCDVNNIEHIFHHRFGQKAEFSGYIDKFYSREIFQFRHRDFLKQLFHDAYLRPRLNTAQQDELARVYVQMLDKGHRFQKVLIRTVGEMIDIDAVRIRSLVKFSVYELADYTFSYNELRMQAFAYPLLSLIHLLRQLFPRLEDLDAAIAELAGNYHSDYSVTPKAFDDGGYARELINYSLPFISPDTIFTYNITSGEREMNVLNEKGRGYVIKYRLTEDFENGGGKMEYIVMYNPDQVGVIYRPNPFHLFLHAFRFCRQNGLLH
ncbi:MULTISPECIES: P-loop NTPase fold protein [Pedobacter]|uniref:KAP family P-loop domain-containing protein n=1 Tax=Pedobacter soli TaxID=390242 RepID=A0A1G6JY67_9SPHI|nr:MULTISPECIES: P-loop NTPase fold protein [Pedobacter]SDC23729.1 KAP family P-loop domain-containing protein [Pedobacter soli]